MRDIQTIAWVAQRHYGANSFGDMMKLGFLTWSEHITLMRGLHFLWKLRYGMHMLEGRREDRLRFDMQRALAAMFDHRDDKESLGVEKLMKQYYRAVGNLRGLNDMLLQHLDEAILRGDKRESIIDLKPPLSGSQRLPRSALGVGVPQRAFRLAGGVRAAREQSANRRHTGLDHPLAARNTAN